MIKYIDRETNSFVVENPPAEGLMQFIYQNPLGKWTFLPIAKRKFVSEWYGRKMSKKRSAKKISAFVQTLNIDMTESIKRIDEFDTFNAFFYRKLKPEARPIQNGLISPGDGRLFAFKSSKEVSSFFVKGQPFTLHNFLQDSILQDKYKDGPLLILRLAPNDYHRYHFPYDGTPTASTLINGHYLSVSPIALASNFTKVFCENKRSFLELQTPNNGDILLAPVGATMVGSINDTFMPNRPTKKGDEMGYFAFGGSTIVMLLEKGRFTVDNDLYENTQKGYETYVKMGERIGEAAI